MDGKPKKSGRTDMTARRNSGDQCVNSTVSAKPSSIQIIILAPGEQSFEFSLPVPRKIPISSSVLASPMTISDRLTAGFDIRRAPVGSP
jgi:hypothetical protein